MLSILVAFMLTPFALIWAAGVRQEAAKERREKEALSYKNYRLQQCLDNTHASIREHRAQLERDYGIYYDAPCDWYRKAKKGALDD